MLWKLVGEFRLLLIASVIASIIAGLGNVALIASINAALTRSVTHSTILIEFALAAMTAVAGRTASGVLFHRLSQGVLAKLRLHIAAHILAADYRDIEETGAAKINSALTDDSNQISVLFVSLPAVLTNLVIVAGCLAYLAFLSWPIFLLALTAIAIGAFGYHGLHLRALKELRAASESQVRLFDHFGAIVEGAKELKLNAAKRGILVNDLLGRAVSDVRRKRVAGLSWFCLSGGFGSFLIFAFIGVVLFALTGDAPEQIGIATSFTLLFLYMVTPLEVLLNNIPQINLARIAAQRVEQLLSLLPVVHTDAAARTPIDYENGVQTLVLRDVAYAYRDRDSGEGFTVGPFDLSFARGELVFLVGGNGSGKTTLAKILTGLYVPTKGDILLNGVPVDHRNREDYRRFFAAIFFDFYLFESLIGVDGRNVDERGNRLVEQFDLQQKVFVSAGAFSTRSLSQGQRKRLALIAMLLEDRPFLVFDEWAADQDSLHRDVFYREILPDLKRLGKIVLVISHDDRYFHLADRVLKMRDGRIETDGVDRRGPESSAAAVSGELRRPVAEPVFD
jgi:putative ATP-binding cassette transporter